MVDLWGGYADAARTRPWERDSLVSVASTTKGITALCAYRLIERGQLDLERPVAHSALADFAEAVARARAQDEASRVARMTSVAIGGQVLEETETETVLKDGTIRRERRCRFAPPDWRPDAWLLERRSPRYARPKVRKDDGGDGKAPPFAATIEKVWELMARAKDPRALPPSGEGRDEVSDQAPGGHPEFGPRLPSDPTHPDRPAACRRAPENPDGGPRLWTGPRTTKPAFDAAG